MKLRDEYCNLDELCAALDISLGDICGRMKNIGYYYDSEDNAFIRV
jgi:DNA-binding Xre family transcriptional regulator